MHHVEDAVCRGAVGGLLWDGGHGAGHNGVDRCWCGRLSLVGDSRRIQRSSSVDCYSSRSEKVTLTKRNIYFFFFVLFLVCTWYRQVNSPREVGGSGRKRLHDFRSMCAPHPGDKW